MKCKNCGKEFEKNPSVWGRKFIHKDTKNDQCDLWAEPAEDEVEK